MISEAGKLTGDFLALELVQEEEENDGHNSAELQEDPSSTRCLSNVCWPALFACVCMFVYVSVCLSSWLAGSLAL
jgi:hypothetical protein